MYEKRHLLIIAQSLEVMEHINTSYMTTKDIKRIIGNKCKLDDSGIRIAIENAKLDLNETDRQRLIEDVLDVRRVERLEKDVRRVERLEELRIMASKTSSNNEGVAATSSNNEGVTASAIASNDYATLMLVGQINSFLGWLMVIGCGLGILYGAGTGQGSVIIGAALLLPISLLVVASGQVVSCFVSTTRNGKQTNILLQNILDKMEAAG